MSAEPLQRLERLASQRVDQSRDLMQRAARQLHQIEQQHKELTSINREYQQGIVGKADVAPQLLEHRRAFVEKLTQKLTELSDQRTQGSTHLDRQMQELHQRTAQHSAIEIINERKAAEQRVDAVRREQQQLDEVAQGHRFGQDRGGSGDSE